MSCESIAGAILAIASMGCENTHPAAATAPVTVAAPASVLQGRWTWTLRWKGCAETYVFGPDATGTVYSNEEVTAQTVTLSPETNSSGFYELQYRIQSDNGGADCGGNRDNNTGEEGLSFVRFHESGDMMLLCKDTGFKNCIGPLLRVPQTAATDASPVPEPAAATASPGTSGPGAP